jgi:hypothetical protein
MNDRLIHSSPTFHIHVFTSIWSADGIMLTREREAEPVPVSGREQLVPWLRMTGELYHYTLVNAY